ncbi:MAG: DUF120 domain-containing protein [Desulfurococcaceae archaeon]
MSITIRGKVVSGIAQAGYYVERYKDLFKPLLGADPYPGTLNVKLEKCIWDYTSCIEPIVIKPSEPGLCEAYVFKGRIKGLEVLIVKPVKSVHDCTIVEIIAGVKLRDLLGLKDGDPVEIVI